MPELEIAPEKIGWLILKARAFDAKVAPAIRAEDSSEDEEHILMENARDDPDAAEISGFIRALNVDEAINLVALVWVGRGTYDIDSWEEALETARSERTTGTDRYLLGLPMLADYLAEGLSAFGMDPAEAEADALGQ